MSRRFDYSCHRQRGVHRSTPAKATTPKPAEHFLEARFLDATGVFKLVGQSGGIKNMKSSKSCSCPSRAAHPKLEGTKIEVSEGAAMILESYMLTGVSREENSQGSMHHAESSSPWPANAAAELAAHGSGRKVPGAWVDARKQKCFADMRSRGPASCCPNWSL
jgi:hypothetical protein